MWRYVKTIAFIQVFTASLNIVLALDESWIPQEYGPIGQVAVLATSGSSKLQQLQMIIYDFLHSCLTSVANIEL
jgi:hypothetical protein